MKHAQWMTEEPELEGIIETEQFLTEETRHSRPMNILYRQLRSNRRVNQRSDSQHLSHFELISFQSNILTISRRRRQCQHYPTSRQELLWTRNSITKVVDIYVQQIPKSTRMMISLFVGRLQFMSSGKPIPSSSSPHLEREVSLLYLSKCLVIMEFMAELHLYKSLCCE